MKNQTTQIIKIGGDLSELKRAIEQAGQLFENLRKNGSPPKALPQSYDKIVKILDKIQAKTKDGVFKGSDAEYASIIKELGTVGEEFETVARLVTEIAKLDDDSLSKFLSKEDLATFRQASNSLQTYYDLVEKLKNEDSKVLSEAKAKTYAATVKQTEAKAKMDARQAEFNTAEQAVQPVLDQRETVKTNKAKMQESQDELALAKGTEKSKKAAVDAIQGEIDALDAEIEKEKAALSDELLELKNAKAAFAKIKKFYEEPGEDGQKKDKTKDYGNKSYTKAEQRYTEAESKFSHLRELEKQREQKKSEKQTAVEEYSISKAAVSESTKKLEENNRAVVESQAELRELEKINSEALETYEKRDTALKEATKEFERKSAAVRDAEAAQKAAQEAEDEGTNQAKELSQAYQELRKNAEELGINLQEVGATEEYSEEAAKALTQAIEKKKQALLADVRVSGDYANTLEKAEQALIENREEIEKTAAAQKELNEVTARQEAFESKIKQFLGMSGAAQVLRSSIRNAMSTIKELDATMTEMAVVTDLSVGDYWDQLPQYTQRANELGVAINDAYEAATLYYQQGLKTNEVNAISTETLKMAKIAGLSAADATDKMTAALRGFNMELNEASAKRISDVYSELAAITAADVDDISNAMTKTASIASSAGMEFETTAAFLSQIIETTRESAETAGTALKTVIARFQELKKDPSEIGEVDGEIVDANAIETALRSVGVALRDSSGQFRELDDVFLELSSKWDGLDKNTQRYIATIAAGSRQQSRFIAMMQDYGRTQELVTAANTSAGASQKQFEKTMESLEAKLAKLKNAWAEFTMGIMNSDLVKAGVDVLTKFLEVVNKATGALDGIGGSLTKIIGVIGLFKLGKKLFDKFADPITKFFLDLTQKAHQGGYDAAKAYVEGGKKAAAEQEGAEQQTPVQPKNEPKETAQVSPKKKMAGWLAEKTGIDDFAEAKKQGKEAKVYRQITKGKTPEQVKQTNEEIKKIEQDYTFGENGRVYQKGVQSKKGQSSVLTKEEGDKVKARYEELNKEAENYANAEANYVKASNAKWEAVSNGLGKAGSAATGVGMAMSALGGVLSAMGLEEFGEGLSEAGNYVMIFGSILSTLPAIFSLISTVATATGITISTALWMVTLIVAAVAAVVGIVVGVVSAINKASPEAKLKAAEESAEKAAEAADEAAASYDKLASAFDSLDGKYKALEDLTRGTKEWNEAVRDINSSVLDLIDEYPELAKFAENKEGVLTIDMQSNEVQNVLKEAETRKLTTKNESILADVAVSQASAGVQFGELDAIEKIANKRGWETAGNWIGGGAATGAGIGGVAGGTVGGMVGSLFSPVGTAVGAVAGGGITAAVGAVIGTIVGGIGGAIAGPIEAAATKNDELLQDAVADLAKSVSSGEVSATYDEMYQHLKSRGINEEEAAILAEEFSRDLDTLTSYGDSLEAIELKQQAAYDAIASSAQGLANTLDMTAEQMQQSSVLVGGDISKEFYEKKMAELGDFDVDADSGDGDYGGHRSEVEAAIREKYGSEAVLGDNGKVTYRGSEGEDKTVTLTAEEMKTMIATQYATKMSASAIEYSDDAILAAAKVIGSDAINNLYMANEGGALRNEDIDVLKEALGGIDAKSWNDMTNAQKEAYTADLSTLPESIQKAWEEMGAGGQLAYGDDITNFIDDLAKGVEIAEEAFSDAGDAVRDFMTADMAKAWKNKLEDADKGAQVYADSANSAKIEEATDRLMSTIVDASGQIDKDKQAEIQNRINMTDWSNLEDLLSLQLDLVDVYGMDIEAAKEYTSVLATVSHATSGLITTIEAFGAFYQANEKVERSLKKITDLQWEYNRALEKGGGNVGQLIQEQIDAYQELASGYEDRYRASSTNLEKILARAYDKESFGGHALSDYFTVRKDGSLDTSKGKDGLSVQDLYSVVSESEKENIKQLLQEYEEEYKLQQDSLKGLKDAIDGIDDLEKQVEDAYYDLRDLAKNAVLDSLQKQIDLQSDLLDATNNANSQLINKIQEQINETRQARQNEETEKNIEDLRSQAAYLGMDTSGGNALEQLALEEQIAQAERDYQDTLVDQSIQSLQDANERAAEQRERQIVIAEQQLQAYTESKQFQEDIDAQLAAMIDARENWTDTALGETITEYATKEMSSEEIKAWGQNITSQIGSASWRGTDWKTYTDPMKNAITNLPDGIAEAITTGSSSRAVNQQATSLTEANFDLGALGITKDEKGNFVKSSGGEGGGTSAIGDDEQAYLDRLSAVQSRDSDTEKISELQSSISGKISRAKEYGMDSSAYETMDQSTFYQEHTGNLAEYGKTTVKIHGQDQEVTSYTDYLNKVNAKELDGIENLSPREAFGGISVPGTYSGLVDIWNNEQIATGEWFDATVNGKTDTEVELGGRITSKQRVNLLDHIHEKTGSDSTPYAIITAGSLSGLDEDRLCFRVGAGNWRYVRDQGAKNSEKDNRPQGLIDSALDYLELKDRDKKYTKYKYKTGGVVDFTGPAWLDGTPGKPEYVLNSEQTQDYFALQKALRESNGMPTSTPASTSTEGPTVALTEQDGNNIKNLTTSITNNEQVDVKQELLEKLRPKTAFKTGGLADFTGPAWLDGTPSKPEYILNATQTERFFSLIDVLERFDSDKKPAKTSGDNYFDIEINVEKLENDYDVEEVANKIRRMIYEDASYRNVNAINHIR